MPFLIRCSSSAQMHRFARVQLARLPKPILVPQARTFCSRISLPYQRDSTAAACRAFGAQPPFSGIRHLHQTTQAANMSEPLGAIISPDVINQVREYWFEHIPDRHELFVPGAAANQKWYFGGEAVDKVCM